MFKTTFATAIATVEDEVFVECIAIGISSSLVFVCINKEIALAFTGLFIEVWCVIACATGLFKAAFATAVVAVENKVLVKSIAIGISSCLFFICINKEVALAFAGLFIEVWCVIAYATGLI